MRRVGHASPLREHSRLGGQEAVLGNLRASEAHRVLLDEDLRLPDLYVRLPVRYVPAHRVVGMRQESVGTPCDLILMLLPGALEVDAVHEAEHLARHAET